MTDYNSLSCVDCSLTFGSPAELNNHKRRFCLQSGFDSLSALANVELRIRQPIQSQPQRRNEEMRQQAIRLDQYKHQLDSLKPRESNFSTQLNKYDRPALQQSYVSAQHKPTFINPQNMCTMLNKTTSSLGRMPANQKRDYVLAKLDQLKQIRSLYNANDGKRPQFTFNIDKMVRFYGEMLKDCEEEIKRSASSVTRPFTPIIKLSDSHISHKSIRSPIDTQAAIEKQVLQTRQSNARERKTQESPSYIQPQILMLPPQQSEESLKLFSKMMELKSHENMQLLEILLKDRLKQSKTGDSECLARSQIKSDSKGEALIDTNGDYQFRKSMASELTADQRMLLALQQEEMDEFKLVSQLPPDLQELKMSSLGRSAETRFALQKEILNHKMQRLAFQRDHKSFDDQRRRKNQEWATEERKKVLGLQMQKYVNNFEQEFLGPSQ